MVFLLDVQSAHVVSKYKGYTPVNYHGLIGMVKIKMINNTEENTNGHMIT